MALNRALVGFETWELAPLFLAFEEELVKKMLPKVKVDEKNFSVSYQFWVRVKSTCFIARRLFWLTVHLRRASRRKHMCLRLHPLWVSFLGRFQANQPGLPSVWLEFFWEQRNQTRNIFCIPTLVSQLASQSSSWEHLWAINNRLYRLVNPCIMFLRQKSVILPFVISHFESGHFMTFLRVIFLILRKQCMLLTFDDWPIWSWG